MIAPVAPGTGDALVANPVGADPTASSGTIAAIELSADTLTPVAAALRLKDRLAFILESVEGGARYGRYSFVGVRGRQRWILPMAIGTVIDVDDVTESELDLALDRITPFARGDRALLR